MAKSAETRRQSEQASQLIAELTRLFVREAVDELLERLPVSTVGSPTGKWIRLRKYCEETGDTAGAVHAKRRRGEWQDGKQCAVGPDGNLWICRAEIDRWVESGGPPGAPTPRAGL